MTNNMTPEMIYMGIGRLVENTPDLDNVKLTPQTQKWLADAYTLVQASGELTDLANLRLEIDILTDNTKLQGVSIARQKSSANKIQTILYRALAATELESIMVMKESFIPAGKGFDAFSAITKIFDKAKKEILIIDPYLDEKILTEFALATPDNVTIKLLADVNHCKASLLPAIKRWVKQYGDLRPIELRFASRGILHDRLIIVDNANTWSATQSFKDFATRSSGKIMQSQEPSAEIKDYKIIWKNAKIIQT